jgi:AraC-like DNA-binding protein
MAVAFTVRPPAPALAPFVAHVWHCESDLAHARERVLPQGTMQLLVNLAEDELRWYDGPGNATRYTLGGAAMCGPFARHLAIDTAEQRAICGVSFRPGGAAAFLAMPADELRDRHVELAALWGTDGRVLREQLLEARGPHAVLRTLEAALLRRLAIAAPDGAVAFALRELDAGAQVGAVTDRLGLSPARFIQKFRATVGLTPKRYARVRRFNRVLETVAHGGAIDWARVAADCGYADQAHLIHEFRAFSGLSPTAYQPRSPVDLRHGVID